MCATSVLSETDMRNDTNNDNNIVKLNIGKLINGKIEVSPCQIGVEAWISFCQIGVIRLVENFRKNRRKWGLRGGGE